MDVSALSPTGVSALSPTGVSAPSPTTGNGPSPRPATARRRRSSAPELTEAAGARSPVMALDRGIGHGRTGTAVDVDHRVHSGPSEVLGLIRALDHRGDGAGEPGDAQLLEGEGVRVVQRHGQHDGVGGAADDEAVPELMVGGVAFEHGEPVATQRFDDVEVVVDADDAAAAAVD